MSLDQPLNRLGRRAGAGDGSATGGRGRAAAAWVARLRPGRIVVAVVAALVVLGAGYLLVRNSSFVRVTRVRITGVSTSAQPRIDAALQAAARGMSTMNVNEDALRRSVAGFPSVAGLRVSTQLPHGLTIEVLERRPVAAVAAGRSRLAVSADGRLLRDVQDTIGLPAIVQGALPVGDRVASARTRAALAVAAAAPDLLRRRAERITYGAKGLTVRLLNGPPLIFGTAAQAPAKWTAATRVMADPTSAGATYLDLREPGRVSAGGLGPVAAEDAQGDAQQTVPGATPTPVPQATATPAPYSQP